jgi:5-methylthioadenosine/S-adenosylhomocysteine deaminase
MERIGSQGVQAGMRHSGSRRMSTTCHDNADAGTRESKPDLVIAGGTALTMVEGQAPIPDARILIKDGIIKEIRKAEPEEAPCGPDVETIDAGNCILMPGLVNAHTHMAMTLFRGFADDLPLKEWLHEKIFPAEAAFLNEETVYWGSLLACLEMIASGTTCLADGYFFQDSTVRAVSESGLRGLIAQGVLDLPAPGVTDTRESLKLAKEFIEKWLDSSELITPGIFCHSPLTCSGRTLTDAMGISESFGLPLQIHLSETSLEVDEVLRKTGKRPVDYLYELGLLHEGLIAAHAVHLDEKEIERLQENGSRVVHVPESNMKLGSGAAKVSRMIKKGLCPGIGTDGCSSNNNLDLFQEMDTAAKLSKVIDLDPVALKAETVLKMATIWGAAALGLAKEIGSLEVGKMADIITIDLNSPHLCPLYDVGSAIVYAANGADVRDVIVNGRVLMRNRVFTTLDAALIMEKVNTVARKIGSENPRHA